MKYTYTFCLLFVLSLLSCDKSLDRRPNILLCVMDDASYQHMSAYGCKWVNTPTFDRLAKEGLLFESAYTPNAKCAPSRSSLLTGRNSWQLEQAANHVVNFPKKFVTFPEELRRHGYRTAKTGKGWGPGNPGMLNGQIRELIGTTFNNIKTKPSAKGMSSDDYAANFNEFIESTNDGKPWFFWYGAREPHRRYEYGSGQKVGGKKLTSIEVVPNFWPDNEIVRNDLLDYALEIEHADLHLGKMLSLLEERGELNNTIVIMTSDNGMPFPRCKAQEYEYSNHMPLAIMWPDGIKNSGRKIKDKISFIDIAPTLLEVAKIPASKSHMKAITGHSFTDVFYSDKEGQVSPERNHLLIGKERHDYSRPNNEGYPIRGIIVDSLLYLYNYKIDRWPAGNPEIGYLDCDGSPTKTNILEENRKSPNGMFWKLSFGKRTQHEELYNIVKDPECLFNIASSAHLLEKKKKIRSFMEAKLRKENDPRMFGNGAIFDSYGFSEEKGWFYYERFQKGEFTMKNTSWVNPSDKDNAL